MQDEKKKNPMKDRQTDRPTDQQTNRPTTRLLELRLAAKNLKFGGSRKFVVIFLQNLKNPKSCGISGTNFLQR
jgi:hypothetical protein